MADPVRSVDMDIQIKGWNMHRVIAHAPLLLMLWLGGAAYAGTVTNLRGRR